MFCVCPIVGTNPKTPRLYLTTWFHYASTWFLLDLISSVPFEEISSGGMMDLQMAKLLKLGKLGRVAKMLTDAPDFAAFMGDLVDNKLLQNFHRRGGVVVKMVLVCHWLACVLKMADDGCLSGYRDVSLSVPREYLAAVYWATTTLTTVGYGDITPQSDLERFFTIVAMVVGGGFYGYIIGSITSMVASFDLYTYVRIHAWL